MAGYSKESKKQNKALEDILRGSTPEKSIFMPVEDVEFAKKQQEKRDKEREKAIEKLDALQEFRMPWFCPKCDRTMGKRLDSKYWRLRGKCSECVIEEETEMRAKGTWDLYEKKIVLHNKISWINDQIISVTEWLEQSQKDRKFYNQNNPDGHTLDEETWKVNKEHMSKMGNEALEKYKSVKVELQEELNKLQ